MADGQRRQDAAIRIAVAEPSHAPGFTERLLRAGRAHRADLVALLRQLPGFVEAASKIASDGKTYRLLVTPENVHLVQENAKGVVKPWLRDARGRFVENVDLVRVPPDFAGALATFAIQATLREISAKIEVAIRGIQDIDALMRRVNQGAVHGAIGGLKDAASLRDPAEQRRQIFAACIALRTPLGSLAGQTKANIARMPVKRGTFAVIFKGAGHDEANAAYVRVREDFAVLSQGMSVLVRAFASLGEHDAALTAFLDLRDMLGEDDLQTAADRARRLPFGAGEGGPEEPFEAFLAGMPLAEARLRALAAGETPTIEIDLNPMDLRA